MKIKKLKYNNHNGKTTACLKNKRGDSFWGIANIHPEDKEWQSERFGKDLALTRAELSAAEHMAAEARTKLKIIDNFLSNLSCCNNFDKESPTAKTVFRQRNMAAKELDAAIDKVKILKWVIREMCETGALHDDIVENKLLTALEKGEID